MTCSHAQANITSSQQWVASARQQGYRGQSKSARQSPIAMAHGASSPVPWHSSMLEPGRVAQSVTDLIALLVEKIGWPLISSLA